MHEFILLFRNAPAAGPLPSAEQLKNISKPWEDWISSIAAQGKLLDKGNRLGFEGVTVRPDYMNTDGPYAEIKEILLGYTVVKTATLEEATELASSCPVLSAGGNVEVRRIIPIPA